MARMLWGVPQRPVTITDLDDPRVAVYRDVRDADLRGRDGLFMAESELVIRRLLRTPGRLHSLLLSPGKYERLCSAIAEAEGDYPIYLADVETISAIAGFHIHRGALAAGYRLPTEQFSLDAALGHLRTARERAAEAPCTLLIAEGWTNVDNMGSLFRNAAAFGVNGIVLDSTCCDPLYRKSIRVSAGHVLSIPYAVADDWPDALGRLRDEWGVTIVAAESTPQARPLWELPRDDRSPRMAIVLGNEGHGIGPATLALCDGVYEIPMSPDVPSLNVSTAAAVFLYELIRHRSK